MTICLVIPCHMNAKFACMKNGSTNDDHVQRCHYFLSLKGSSPKRGLKMHFSFTDKNVCIKNLHVHQWQRKKTQGKEAMCLIAWLTMTSKLMASLQMLYATRKFCHLPQEEAPDFFFTPVPVGGNLEQDTPQDMPCKVEDNIECGILDCWYQHCTKISLKLTMTMNQNLRTL